MIEFVQALESEMAAQLQTIAETSKNCYEKANRSWLVVVDIFQRLKVRVLNHQFPSEEEEIKFFKQIMPGFLKEAIYYYTIFQVEANRPVACPEALRRYFQNELEYICHWFRKEQAFYNYYRSGNNGNDRKYYLRSAFQIPCELIGNTEVDLRTCTPYSHKVAMIMALKQVHSYLLQSLNEIDTPPAAVKTRHKWTDSKVALIELAYSIYARGALSNGNAELKDIVDALQQAFNIDVGNYYTVFQQNIRIRKKNRTAYLDQLRDYLVRHMDELDEHPR